MNEEWREREAILARYNRIPGNSLEGQAKEIGEMLEDVVTIDLRQRVRLEAEVAKLRAEVTRLLCDNQTMRNALTVVIESGKHNDDIGMRELLLVSIGFKPSPSEGDLTKKEATK